MSDKQIEASRKNGAKSNGPVTPEGKNHSSQNAVKHGLCSRRMLLPDESPEKLRELEVYWLRHLWPESQAERELALNVAAAAWRMQRCERIEASMLANEMAKHGDEPEALGRAFDGLANSGRGLDLLTRYAARARRDFEHALETYHKTVDRRREEMALDAPVMNKDDFFAKWGLYPKGSYSSMYYRQEFDDLPNKPAFNGIIADSGVEMDPEKSLNHPM